MSRLVVSAPGKLNLWLRIFGRDAKGYHAIESLYQLVSIADELVVERTEGGISLEGAPAALGPVEQNLVMKAARAWLKAARVTGGAAITLTKNVPWNAGLGGGSSDAAATLLALNQLLHGRLPLGDLVELGASLGADVPFFLARTPLALAWGRGERLLALPPLPAMPLLIVPPPVEVKTADAYAWLDKDRGVEETGEYAAVLPSAALASWDDVRRLSHNDFEPVVAGRLPQIGHWLDRLRSTDPFLVRLCGSGGAMAALYRSESERDAAWRRLGADPSMLRGQTLDSLPHWHDGL